MLELLAIIVGISVLVNAAIGYVVYQFIQEEKEELKYLREEVKKVLKRKS